MAEMIGRTKSWLAWLAGAVLALVFGSAGCGKDAPPVVKYGPPPAPPVQPAPKPPEVSPAVSLEETEEWRAVLAAFKPVDYAKREVAEQGQVYAGALAALGKLRDRGLLTPQEAELLIVDIRDRDKEWRVATTCYDMEYVPAPKRSLALLQARLPLLQELVRAGKLHRPASDRVLAAVESDLAMLSTEAALAKLGNRRPEAEKTRDAVKAEVEKLKKLLDAAAKPAASLEASPDWKVITDAWDFAMPFARSGRSTTAQRKQIDEKLAAAREAVKRLASAGLLSAKEAELLDSEAGRAAKDIRREPPVDVECYLMASIPPPNRLSLTSIKDRLPAIEELIKGGKVHPAALRKVLEAIEADLVALADEKRRAELGDQTPKAEAEKTRDAVKAAVEKLRKLLAEGQKP